VYSAFLYVIFGIFSIFELARFFARNSPRRTRLQHVAANLGVVVLGLHLFGIVVFQQQAAQPHCLYTWPRTGNADVRSTGKNCGLSFVRTL
jgi:hypothetical protein